MSGGAMSSVVFGYLQAGVYYWQVDYEGEEGGGHPELGQEWRILSNYNYQNPPDKAHDINIVASWVGSGYHPATRVALMTTTGIVLASAPANGSQTVNAWVLAAAVALDKVPRTCLMTIRPGAAGSTRRRKKFFRRRSS